MKRLSVLSQLTFNEIEVSSMKTTTEGNYRGYLINTGSNNNLPCNTKTLDQYIERQDYMVENHSKTLAVRLDIRTPSGSAISLREKMPRILESTKRKLESKNKSKNKIDMQHVWTAEKRKTGGNEHIHLALLVNGNAIQNGYSLKDALEKAVERQIPGGAEGLVEFCASNGKTGILLERGARDFEDKARAAVYAASYLAKTRSKENKAKGARFSSASRLPSGWR